MSPFDPYHKWLGIPPAERPISKYRLLGVAEFENDSEVINSAAERQTVYLRTMQAGEDADLIAQLLNEVSQARVTLLDPEQKSAYDAQLRIERTPKEAQPTPAASPIVQPAAPAVNLPAPPPSGPRNVATPREQTGFQIVWKRPKVIGLSIAGGLLILIIFFMLGGSDANLKTFTGHRTFYMRLAFSPDGKTIASGALVEIIKLWDVSALTEP
tara:strand:- start:557 stop:1195 length:639 start_codon:yes stop_codon:yes gene_type:complete